MKKEFVLKSRGKLQGKQKTGLKLKGFCHMHSTQEGPLG